MKKRRNPDRSVNLSEKMMRDKTGSQTSESESGRLAYGTATLKGGRTALGEIWRS